MEIIETDLIPLGQPAIIGDWQQIFAATPERGNTMKTIDPVKIVAGSRLRVIQNLKPSGPLVEGRKVCEGTVDRVVRDRDGHITHVVFADDDGNYVLVRDDEHADVAVEQAPWPEGTIAYADVVANDNDEVAADVLLRKASYGWVEVVGYGSYHDVDIDSGQIELRRLRVIHDGKIPA